MDVDTVNALLKLVVFIQGAGFLAFGALALKFHIDKQKLKLERDRLAESTKTERDTLAADVAHEKRTLALDVEKHRDDLAIQLLRTAGEEIAVLRGVLKSRRITEAESDIYAQHFETALGHVRALIEAEDARALKAARRSARAFLNRMRRLQEARGTMANEEQRIDSEISLAVRHDDGTSKGGNGSDPADA